jgi:hypothetical protein
VLPNLNQTRVTFTKFNETHQNIKFYKNRLARSRVIIKRRQKRPKDLALDRTTDIDTTFRREHAKTNLVRAVNSLTDSYGKHTRILHYVHFALSHSIFYLLFKLHLLVMNLFLYI